MPRTKGSKNKPKTMTADFATQIAEKQSAKEALTAEIASITANIDTLKAELKEKKAARGILDSRLKKRVNLRRFLLLFSVHPEPNGRKADKMLTLKKVKELVEHRCTVDCTPTCVDSDCAAVCDGICT